MASNRIVPTLGPRGSEKEPPKTSKDLPYEIASQIASEMTIDQICDKNLTGCLFHKSYSDRLAEDKMDFARVFSPLTSNYREMVDVMLGCDIYLVGSRAANYFVPGMAIYNSDWDFVCMGMVFQRGRFVDWMIKQGMKILPREALTTAGECTDAPYTKGGLVDVLNCSIEKDGLTHRIQMLLVVRTTIVEEVLRYHSTIVHCYIGGYGAVHLSWRLASKRKSVWLAQGYERSESTKRKYESRGVEYVGFVRYSDMSKTGMSSLRNYFKIRTPGDDDCYAVRRLDDRRDMWMNFLVGVCREHLRADSAVVWKERVTERGTRWKVLSAPGSTKKWRSPGYTPMFVSMCKYLVCRGMVSFVADKTEERTITDPHALCSFELIKLPDETCDSISTEGYIVVTKPYGRTLTEHIVDNLALEDDLVRIQLSRLEEWLSIRGSRNTIDYLKLMMSRLVTDEGGVMSSIIGRGHVSGRLALTDMRLL